MNFCGREELLARVKEILKSPADAGALEMIVCRPGIGEREILQRGELSIELGLIGDNWKTRGSSKTEDGHAHPGMQLTVLNSRVIAAVAGSKDRWPLAGDQMYVDLDLRPENLPAGSRLTIGSAIVEVSSTPHTGCKKFIDRFGLDAAKFVGSESGRKQNFRGINVIVIQSGTVSVGDQVCKVNDGECGNEN